MWILIGHSIERVLFFFFFSFLERYKKNQKFIFISGGLDWVAPLGDTSMGGYVGERGEGSLEMGRNEGRVKIVAVTFSIFGALRRWGWLLCSCTEYSTY
jgi:hypothetical protein